MNKKLIAVLLLSLVFAGRGMAQPKDAMRELIALNEHFLKQDTLRFDIAYYYEEEDSMGVITDTLSGHGKIGKGMSYMELGDIIKINNNQYSVLIDKEEKEIYVYDANEPVRNYMGNRLTEADFMNNYVDSATVIDSPAIEPIAIISVAFKEAAPYHWYRIAYNTSTMYPLYIQYSMKKDTEEIGVQRAVRLKTTFSGYANDLLPPETFDTNSWFTRKAGVLVVQPDSGFTITDLTTKDK